MGENQITMKSVQELLQMKFFIPQYQRGYRWTTQQVQDLLDDVSKEKTKGEFYCLQPLVVREMTAEDKARTSLSLEGVWYEVIDGQQRLTTIYLILLSLRDVEPPRELYQLKYQRSPNNDSDFFLNVDKLTAVNDSSVDYYHLSTAYLFIKRWIEENEEDKEDKERLAQTLLQRVRFIWYESVDENPIKVFTRLNVGKIALTSAELIKALMLNRRNFGDEERLMRLRQQEIASEWDRIEAMLQREDLWLFLCDIGYTKPTRIDFIFDLICSQNKLKLGEELLKSIGTDEYKTFRYFDAYFRGGEASIEECWKVVKLYYQTFIEWYEDLELYHYVGFLRAVGSHSVEALVKKWIEAIDKRSFVAYLKQEVAERLKKCPPLNHQYDADGADKGKCRPLLLFHNIQTVINQNRQVTNHYQLGLFYKFPFHLYKLENWDVEHINPSMDNSEDDERTRSEWLANVYQGVPEEIQEEIRAYAEDEVGDKKSLFEAIKAKVSLAEGWSQEEKNQIGNYVLLDSSTNRSYGNAIFSAKRRIIMAKDRGLLLSLPKIGRGGTLTLGDMIGQKAKSAFIPPCTKQVFMKYYSPVQGESNYWTKDIDAKAYTDDIQSCIDELNKGNEDDE